MPREPHPLTLGEFTRRRWLRGAGGLTAASLLPSVLEARAGQTKAAPAKSAIVIYLQGGLSHYESFDPKPLAPSDYRGEFGSIPSSVAGTHVCEYMPHLAARAHKYNILRSVYVDSPSHPVAIHMTLTGWDLPGADVAGKNRNSTNPSIGSVVARLRGSSHPGIPAYVAVPHMGQLGTRVHYATAGLLGGAYDAIESGLPPNTAIDHYDVPPDLAPREGLGAARLRERLDLLESIQSFQSDNLPTGLDKYHAQAYEMLAGNAASLAFDINREPEANRRRYGNHLWGQQTILSRRLSEAGVPFTLVNYTLTQHHGQDWDTHVDNFGLMKNTLLPPMDLAVSTLLDDLEERGLLDTTLVAMFGEFGRTPKINAQGGRDHWSNVCSVMLAGGGLKSGMVVGSSSRDGAEPHDRPIHFNDVLATIYRQLGVPTDFMFRDALGRPLPVLATGRPIEELLT